MDRPAPRPMFEPLEQRVFLSAAPVEPAELISPPQAVVMRKAITEAIVIDHAALAGIGRLRQATLDRIATTCSFFFAHASVGGNILDGLNALRSANPKKFKLRIVSDDGAPGTVAKGRIYEYNRGNPSWQEKVDGFAEALAAGWGAKAKVVINKFCYIDPGATLQYYAISNAQGSAMSQLEAKYPNSRFVYTTIPLTSGNDADNVRRNKFNIALRKWAKANGKILLDLADIEAWSPAGAQSTFKAAGKTWQKLYGKYTTDGGHLNAAGAKRQAMAWYALGAALLKR